MVRRFDIEAQDEIVQRGLTQAVRPPSCGDSISMKTVTRLVPRSGMRRSVSQSERLSQPLSITSLNPRSTYFQVGDNQTRLVLSAISIKVSYF